MSIIVKCKRYIMTNKTYDILKYIALIVLPALAVFYSTLSNIWGLPYHDAIPDTIMAVDLLLGALLKISSSKYGNTVVRFDDDQYDGAPAYEEEN